MRRVRDEIGLTNVVLMVPFCRTLEEADQVLDAMGQAGLVRGRNGLEVYVMAEVPSNILLAEEFADRFDGFSIGSNDLTQLTLGVDRDSAALAHLFDERNQAVSTSVEQLIKAAHAKGAKVGLCGQRPSDDPDYARLLVRVGIDSISVAPDTFLRVKDHVTAAERGEGP
jgi:pyruvate,water dikinase